MNSCNVEAGRLEQKLDELMQTGEQIQFIVPCAYAQSQNTVGILHATTYKIVYTSK